VYSLKDCKPMAKAAINKFKSLKGVLDADIGELTTIKGIGTNQFSRDNLFKALSERYAKEKLSNKVILNSSQLAAEYLQVKLAIIKKSTLSFYISIQKIN